MEERHSSMSVESADARSNYEPIFEPGPFPSIQDRSSITSIESETYVIQIPKEQIFSIPPPENAIIAQRYRNPKTKNSPRVKWLLCAIITSIALACIIGLTIGAIHIFFNPEAPSFSIVHVHVKNNTHSSHHQRNVHFRYEIMLKAKNKNEAMANFYGNGHATLLYKEHKIGTGKFPEFDQVGDSLTKIQLALTSTNGALPHDIEKSVGDKKGKRHVTLSLKINVPVKMKFWSKVIDVVCNFKVRSLGSAGKNNVLSQHCQSNFN